MCLAAGYRPHRFVLEALHDGESSRVVDVLHDQPVNGLLVLAVDPGRLDQLQLDLFDRLGVVIGVEVDGERVNHRVVSCLFRGCNGDAEMQLRGN